MVSPANIVVIFNPAARSGRLAKLELDIRSELKLVLGRTAFIPTSRKGHARQLAANLEPNVEMVVVIGGDGSVHEVAAGLAESNSKAGMAIIPLGSGNDFARALQLSESWREAIKALPTSTSRPVDIGTVSWKENETDHFDYFINALGVGFDAHCARIAPRYKGWPFGIGYTVSILVGLKTWVSGGATVWDMSADKKAIFSGRMMFTTIGNAQDSGGGYKINPRALVTDGLIDACIVEDLSFFRALRILPSARDGSHLSQKEVSYFQVKDLLIQADWGLPIHADGEVKAVEAGSIRVSVKPGKLNVFVPASSPSIL